MEVVGRQPFDDVVDRLLDLRNYAVASRNRLSNSYHKLPKSDPRRVVARHIKAVISSTCWSAVHLQENLSRRDWWSNRFRPQLSANEIGDEVEDYTRILTNGLIVFTFALFEAGIRRLARVDPATAGLAAKPARKLFNAFVPYLERGGMAPQPEAVAFLSLLGNMRNLIHDNGTYYGGDERFVWKGKEYRFVAGDSPEFIGWDLDLALVTELINLNEAIMLSPAIDRLPTIP